MSRPARAAGGAFSARTMLAVLLVGVVSLAGLGVLAAYAPEMRSGDDGGGHALSKSAVGFAGLPALLRQTGAPVVMSRGPVGAGAFESLLILTPGPGTAADAVDDIRHDGATLIVLPKWAAVADPGHRGWVRTLGTLPPADTLRVLPEQMRKGLTLTEASAPATVRARRPDGTPLGAPVRLEAARTLSGPNLTPVVVDGAGRALLVMVELERLRVVTDDSGEPSWGDGEVERFYVLADPDLLNTAGLKSLEGATTAAALIELLRAGEAPVMFDLTLHGLGRSRNLLRLMLEPPLLGLSLVLAALAVLAGLQAFARFGPARDRDRAVALGKRALADNTAGLVRMAKREHRMAEPYALLTRGAVARAVGAPRRLGDAELDAFLDRVSRAAGAEADYSELAARARSARTPRDLMTVAAQLHRWTQELTRGRQ